MGNVLLSISRLASSLDKHVRYTVRPSLLADADMRRKTKKSAGVGREESYLSGNPKP